MPLPRRSPDDLRMSFGAHLEELRWRIIKALLAPVIILIPALYFGKPILNWLMAPVHHALASAGLPQRLQALSPLETFGVYFKLAVVVSLVLSAPVLVYHIWRFIAPGLHSHERRFGYLLIPMSAALTIVGCLFLYYVVLPMSLRFLIEFAKHLAPEPLQTPVDIAPSIPGDSTPTTSPSFPIMPFLDAPPASAPVGAMYFDTPLHQVRIHLPNGSWSGVDVRDDSPVSQEFQLNSYVNLVFVMALGFSIAFQLPLVILLLGWVGIVDVSSLRRWRRYAFFILFVAAAAITPSSDIVSMLALGFPLYLLYELSILLLILLPLARLSRRRPGEPSRPRGG